MRSTPPALSVFAASNVLLYAASGRPADAAKAARARQIEDRIRFDNIYPWIRLKKYAAGQPLKSCIKPRKLR
jgi:hypothetical protein